jgi:hypothetical protein
VIEAAGGVGVPLTRRLRADGIEVIDVPAILGSRSPAMSGATPPSFSATCASDKPSPITAITA